MVEQQRLEVLAWHMRRTGDSRHWIHVSGDLDPWIAARVESAGDRQARALLDVRVLVVQVVRNQQSGRDRCRAFRVRCMQGFEDLRGLQRR